MECIISDREIEAYAYRDRSDIDRLILCDEVETVKEGAFYHCTDLRYIEVGRNVKEVQMSAFEGIPPKGELVWLSKITYKPAFYRVFQDVGSFASICAPYLPFFKGMLYEKTALAAGFILHPEFENEYSKETRDEYLDYIRNGLESDIKRLLDAGIIIDIIKNLTERGLIDKKRSLESFISHARTLVTSGKDKKFLDGIVERENLSNNQNRDNNFEDRDKKELRFVYFNTNRSEQQFFLDNGDIPAVLPDIYYKDGTKAPADLLRFIMFRYMNQWAFVVRPVPEFEYDKDADRLAEELDIGSLRAALSCMMPEVIPGEKMVHPDMNKSKRGVIHIQRLIPYLRYADQDMAYDCGKRAERFLDYDMYGLSGHKTYLTFKNAVLLCKGKDIPLLALRWGKLPAYAYLNKLDIPKVICLAENCIDRIEKEGNDSMDLTKEKEQVNTEIRDLLYDLYISASTMKYSYLKELCETSRSFEKAAGSLLWKDTESGRYFTLSGEDGEMTDPAYDPYVTPAHSCEMTDEEIIYWKNRTDPVFDQLWLSPEKYTPDNSERWHLKYKGVKTTERELKSMVRRGFELWTNNDRGYSMYFYGKCYIHGQADTNGIVTLDSVNEASFRIREINEAFHAFDKVFFDRLVGLGKVPAQYFLDRFDEKTTGRVLDMAIKNKAHENVAVLLEHKKRFLKGDSDLDL